MELYKLYCILKRHTGYETMLETMRKCLMPEIYCAKRSKAIRILAQMAVMNALLKTERQVE